MSLKSIPATRVRLAREALDAVDLRDQLARGDLTVSDLVERCIARIEARESEVQAWAWFDADNVRVQAEALDALRSSGGPLGPLFGLPVGLKDVIDTAGFPTENGCALDAGRLPESDALVVERLKDAGAVLMGKTITTELAFMHAGKTRNPHNPGHTPGGSSSGSAAAVADGMVPLALGTQTGGSVIRPASFCGVTGFKPSFGAIPRKGVLLQSHTLDTVGVFARDPAGAALLADALIGKGRIRGDSRLLVATKSIGRPPVLAVVRPPGWRDAHPDLHAGFETLRSRLGRRVTEVELPAAFEQAAQRRRIINTAEMAYHFDGYWRAGATRLGPETRDAIAAGRVIPASEYLAAVEWRFALNSSLDTLFARYDALLCPAAPGPAPEGLSSTGDAIFNGLWTLCGTPSLTLPLLAAENGLPMGMQVVAPCGRDEQLMRSAQWLWTQFADGP